MENRPRQSLKRRLVLQVSTFVVLAIALITVMGAVLMDGYLRVEAHRDLEHLRALEYL